MCCQRWYPPFFFMPPRWATPRVAEDLSALPYIAELLDAADGP